jgi:hypothetical protein
VQIAAHVASWHETDQSNRSDDVGSSGQTESQTGLNVQHWLADAPDGSANVHVPVACNDCTKLHFINKTAKLLGEKVGEYPGS